MYLSYTPSSCLLAGVSSATEPRAGSVFGGYDSTCSGDAVSSSFCLGGVASCMLSSTRCSMGEDAMKRLLSTMVDNLGGGVGCDTVACLSARTDRLRSAGGRTTLELELELGDGRDRPEQVTMAPRLLPPLRRRHVELQALRVPPGLRRARHNSRAPPPRRRLRDGSDRAWSERPGARRRLGIGTRHVSDGARPL